MMYRLYQSLLEQHLREYRQMVFFAGPRQVGKTFCSLTAKTLNTPFHYFNWDNTDDQRVIIAGPKAIADVAKLDQSSAETVIIVFDELHKFSRWKQFLKGFFDTYSPRCKIIVTGSSKLDIYKKVGDSLLGRYFLYRVHPISAAEILSPQLIEQEIRKPKPIKQEQLTQLLNFGGFPDPFLKANKRFLIQWQKLKYQQTFHEDIRSLTQIQEMAQLEMLAELLKAQTGQIVNYTRLANSVNVSAPTIQRWIKSFESFYYCFTLRPWSKNVKRSLKKEPKVYLWDWSEVTDPGAKLENMVASHLLKATHFWSDYGLGDYSLYYLRDKEKREVDFLVTRDQNPWFLVEVKQSDNARINPALYTFQEQLSVPHAFQAVFNKEFVNKNCFDYENQPVIVPLATLLSQLV